MAPTNGNNQGVVTTDISPTSTNVDSESQALNGHTANGNGKATPRTTRFRRYMAQDVHEDWADVILIILSFISGMVDSAVFNTWSCFVSMQTGEWPISQQPSQAI